MSLWESIGISGTGALAVVLATLTLYLAFIALNRLLGQRVLASLSSFDLLVVIVLGAVIGRATMGHNPTLAAGLIALVTLFTLEGMIGQLTRQERWERVINNPPALLMAGSHVIDEEMRRFHVTGAELSSRLREAGVRSPEEVAAVILEPTGRLSVMRRGLPIDAVLLRGVRSADRMPEDLLR